MKLGLVQFAPVWNDKAKTITKIELLLEKLETDVNLLIFPEMTLTGFTMDAKNMGEEIDGIGMLYFMKLATKLKIEIMVGIIEKEEKIFYNSLFHFDSKGLIKAVYRKIHPFTLASEDQNYFAGKSIVVSNIDTTKIGLSICYDLRFPELYRLYGKQKVDLMINIANWPIKRIDHWKTLLKARAIENQFFMVGINRVGNDPFQQYNGCSTVFNPMGEELITSENKEEIIYSTIELSEVISTREALPFLNDIRLI